jgi:hypothetical protein
MTTSPERPEMLAAVQALFRDLSPTLPHRHEQLQSLRAMFHSELARALQQPLNAHIAELPQNTYEDKVSVATYVNELLRNVGLSIKDPKTGRRAILLADREDGAHPDIARFRMEVRDDNGRATRTFTTRHQLPELTLIADAPRKTAWTKRIDDRVPRQR